MKKNKWSIKWQLFGYLSGFVGILLIVLWLFQVVFLNDFYESIKTSEIKQICNKIAKAIDEEDVYSFQNNTLLRHAIHQVAEEQTLTIVIVDETGYLLDASENFPNSSIYEKSPGEYRLYMQKAKENGGVFKEQRPYSATYNTFIKDTRFGRNGWKLHQEPKYMQSLIYGQVVALGDDNNIFILVNGLISPIDSTVQTLRKQIIYVSFVMLVCAFLLVLFISKKIVTPIIKINDAAKGLATGTDEIAFDGKGYKEIAELSTTLNYAAKELARTEKLRQELIANVSHDLRTPLTLITGYAEIMRDLPGENTPENTQIIIDEAKRLSQLVSDMLDLSKLQAGTTHMTCTVFNLTQSIKEIMKRYNALIEGQGYHITFESTEDVMIEADELRLSQVLYNLINNAINYTGEDKVVRVKQTVMGECVRIEVIDTGEGISEEYLPYIWDRYYKVDKNHKRAAIGTGLGLSIVRSILDSHHMQYGVESSHAGSIFWFECIVSQKN